MLCGCGYEGVGGGRESDLFLGKRLDLESGTSFSLSPLIQLEISHCCYVVKGGEGGPVTYSCYNYVLELTRIDDYSIIIL